MDKGETITAPYEPNGSTTYVALLDTMKISGRVFRNVSKFNDRQNLLEMKNNTNVYLVRHIGVVRKELINSGKVWNLKRCYIVQ